MMLNESHTCRIKSVWQYKYEQQDPEMKQLRILIEKDVHRTDRSVKFFEDDRNFARKKLLDILMTYSVYHSEPGYVQG
jgi:TBC1 domain family member 15